MTPEMSRILAVDRLPAALTVQATPAECTALAARLQIPGVLSLTCRFQLRRVGNVVLADGALAAQVIQTCVVSLEPVQQAVAETFTIRFVPEGAETNDENPEAPDELTYPDSSIDLGEATTEQLALALDPYPRQENATLENDGIFGETSPFAALRGTVISAVPGAVKKG